MDDAAGRGPGRLTPTRLQLACPLLTSCADKNFVEMAAERWRFVIGRCDVQRRASPRFHRSAVGRGDHQLAQYLGTPDFGSADLASHDCHRWIVPVCGQWPHALGGLGPTRWLVCCGFLGRRLGRLAVFRAGHGDRVTARETAPATVIALHANAYQ